MQKKLIALAIAGLSGAAFAQSNVTVYGVADATFDFINVSGGNQSTTVGTLSNNNPATFDTPNYKRVSSNGSYLGFKGMESLGNGMVAVFQYETAVNLDSASNGLLGLGRDSYVGVAGGFGTVIMGSATGPTRALANALDVNAGTNDNIGSNRALLGKLSGLTQGATATSASQLIGASFTGSGPVAGAVSTLGSTQKRSASGASVFDSYLPNVIAYVSPNFSGFQATVGYVANEGKTDVAGAKFNTSAYDTGLTYTNGPIFAGLTFGRIDIRNADSSVVIPTGGNNLRTDELRLGGKYDFGNASVRVMLARTNLDEGSKLDVKQNVWGIGGTFNVTANGKITGQYYRANDLSGQVLGGALPLNDTGAKFYSLGYEHSLSKRTMLKANYAYLKNDKNAIGYDFGTNTTGLAGPDVKLSGFQVGLRHSF
jgi:predicted porin